ncbi:MAG: MarR family transcriptional regulator [bacterium]
MRNRHLPEPLGVLLSRAARLAEREFEASFEGTGGSRSWWGILRSLSDGHAETQSDLAQQLGLTGATLVHHLDLLEAAGMVARQRNPVNRRLQTVSLTPDGLALFQRLLGQVLAFDTRMRRRLTPETEAALRAGLAAIEAALTGLD